MNKLNLLGKKVNYDFEYNFDILECFENENQDNDFWVKFNCPEFTSLCPITKQPDFATIYISYIPAIKIVESKSLKLYLFSFRNHGSFHESVINIIAKDLFKLMKPKYIEVYGEFLPRGGISIDPFVQLANEDYQKFAKKRLESWSLNYKKIDNR